MTKSRVLCLAAVLLAANFLMGYGAASSFSPHYVSLARQTVNMREGPSYNHPAIWVYHRRGLPMRVLGQYDIWRKVEDPYGTTGWMQSSMLSSARTVMVRGKVPAPVRDTIRPGAHVSAYLQPGVVARPQTCNPTMCEIITAGVVGWVNKKYLWGLEPGETF